MDPARQYHNAPSCGAALRKAELLICGSSAALPTKTNSTTSQVLRVQGTPYLIDAGESVQERLREGGVRFQRIPAIFISHLHGDHVLGLPGLIGTMNLLGRTKKLDIYGPKELRTFLDVIHKCTGTFLKFPIEIHGLDIPKGTREVVYQDNLLEVSAFQVKHRIETYGYRFDARPEKRKLLKDAIAKHNLGVVQIKQLIAGKQVMTESGLRLGPEDCCKPAIKPWSYVFAADTRPCDAVAHAAEGASLLYHEATFLESERDLALKTYHSTAAEAGSIAAQAGVNRLLLGHLSTRYASPQMLAEEAATTFSGDIQIARRGNLFPLQA